MGGRRKQTSRKQIRPAPRTPVAATEQLSCSRASALAQLLSDKLFDCGGYPAENWTATVDVEERQKLKHVFRKEILTLIETQRLLQMPPKDQQPRENSGGWSLSQLRVKQKDRIRRRQERAAKAYSAMTEEKTAGIEWFETVSAAHMRACRPDHSETCFDVENVKEGLEAEETKWCSRMLRARMPGPYDLAWSLRRLIKFQEALAEDIAALNLSPRDPVTRVTPFTEIVGSPSPWKSSYSPGKVDYESPSLFMTEIRETLGLKKSKKTKKNQLNFIAKYLLVKYISSYESASQPCADLQDMISSLGNLRFQNNVLPIDRPVEFSEAYRSFWKVLPQVVALGELQDHFRARASEGFPEEDSPACILECLSSLIDTTTVKRPCLSCVEYLVSREAAQKIPTDLSVKTLRIGAPKQRFRVSNPVWSEWVGLELLLEAEKVRSELALIEHVYSESGYHLKTGRCRTFDHDVGPVAMAERYHRWYDMCVKRRLPLQWADQCLPPRLAFLRRDLGRGEWNCNRPGFINLYELVNQEKDDRISVLKLSGISADDVDALKSLSIIVGAVTFLLLDESKLEKGCICTNVKVLSSRVFVLPSVRSTKPAFRLHQTSVSVSSVADELMQRERNTKVVRMLNAAVKKNPELFFTEDFNPEETEEDTEGDYFVVAEGPAPPAEITQSTIVPLRTDVVDVYIQVPNKTICDIMEAAYLMLRKAVATWTVEFLIKLQKSEIAITVENLVESLTEEWQQFRIIEPLIHMADCALPPHAFEDCSDDEEEEDLPPLTRCQEVDEIFLRDMATSMCAVGAEYYPATFDEVWLQLATPLGPVITALWYFALKRAPDRPTVSMPNGSTLVLVAVTLVEIFASHGINYSAIEENLFGIESGTFAMQPNYSSEFKLAWLDELRRRRDQWAC